MTKTIHTPGPWEVAEKRDGLQIIRNYEAWPVGTVLNCPKLEANAALIAAAPEMLEALKEVIQEMGAEDCPWYDKAKSAIDKAEGR